MPKLTKRIVDALRPQDGRDVFLWDSGDGALKGFGIRMKPSGSAAWLVQYRNAEGRTRRLVLGHISELAPEEARRLAGEKLRDVRHGSDPSAERHAARKTMTVAELCDLYLKEGIATKKASTIATDRGRIERHLKPLLGRRAAAGITRADVERFRDDLAAGASKADVKTKARGRAIVEGGKGTATRTVGLLGGIFTFAVTRGVRPDNPVRGVPRFRDRRMERFLSADEMGRLGAALVEAEADPTFPRYAVAAIRLLIFTGARRGEILSARWTYVDLERGALLLPDSKTGAKVIPLGAPARELLANLPRVKGSPWVLPAGRGDGHLVGLAKPWRAICKAAKLDGLRLHDLRHSFASVGAAGGDSLLIVGKLLGHADAKTTSRYAHLADDPLKAAADRISERIAAAMDGRAGEVVPIRKPA